MLAHGGKAEKAPRAAAPAVDAARLRGYARGPRRSRPEPAMSRSLPPFALLIPIGLLALACAGCAENDDPPVAPAPQATFQRLTSSAVAESAPAFSPDGTRVVYERASEIWILQVSNRLATRVAARGNHPTWSADGSAILFVRRDLEGGGPLHRLVRLDLAGGDIDTLSADSVDVYEPSAAPAGGAVAYRALSRTTTVQSLRVVDAGGEAQATLTSPGTWTDVSPAWSADGAWIAFVRIEGDGAARLHVVPADGDGDASPLGGDGAAGPAWHPDGRIVHARSGAIMTLRRSGGGPAALVIDEAFARDPVVSPDGHRLVFVSDRSGNFELWMLHDPAGIGSTAYRF